MRDFPRQRLCELINRHGTILCENIEQCEFLLRKTCGDKYHPEIFVLTNAIKEGVTKELLTLPFGLPNDAVFNRLAQQLHHNLCLENKSAEWAVQTWGIALGVGIKKPIIIEDSTEEFTNKAVNIASSTNSPFSHFNPFHYLRLMWWIFVMPQHLQAYRKTYGLENEKQIGNWLVSFLIWWPLLIPSLALGFKQLPYSEKAWLPETYLLLSLLLIGSWLLTGWLKINKDVAISVAGIVSVGMAVLVAVSVAGITVSLNLELLVAISVSIALVIVIIGTILVSVNVAGDAAIVIVGIVAIGMAVGVAGSVGILVSDIKAGFVASSLAGFITGFGVDFIAKVMGNRIEKSLIGASPSLLGRLIFPLLILAYLFLIGLFIGLLT